MCMWVEECMGGCIEEWESARLGRWSLNMYVGDCIIVWVEAINCGWKSEWEAVWKKGRV